MAAVLIYDGECSFCTGGIEWIRGRATGGSMEYLPSRSDERKRRYPDLSDRDCAEGMILILDDGRVLRGDRALPEILLRLRGWRWIARLLRLPLAALLSRSAYRWVARNRLAISRCPYPPKSSSALDQVPTGSQET